MVQPLPQVVSGFGTKLVKSMFSMMNSKRWARSSRLASVWSPSSKASCESTSASPFSTPSVENVRSTMAWNSVERSTARVVRDDRP